jgi:hypothetical protein
MLLDFDPTVIAIGSQPFWLRWSEGSGGPVAQRRHCDSAPCHADVVQPVGGAVIDSREGPAITGATGCRVGCAVEPPPPSTLRVAGSTHAPFLLTPPACSQQYS